MSTKEKQKMRCVEVKRIKDTKLMVETIYNNFLYLVEYPELMHTHDEINKVLNSDGCMNLLVFYNNKLIGYLVGDFRTLQDSRYVYYISYFYISKDYRNRGIGSRLMDLLILKCRTKGVKFIVLTCDSQDYKVMKFYRKYNFTTDSILSKNNRHDVYTLYL